MKYIYIYLLITVCFFNQYSFSQCVSNVTAPNPGTGCGIDTLIINGTGSNGTTSVTPIEEGFTYEVDSLPLDSAIVYKGTSFPLYVHYQMTDTMVRYRVYVDWSGNGFFAFGVPAGESYAGIDKTGNGFTVNINVPNATALGSYDIWIMLQQGSPFIFGCSDSLENGDVQLHRVHVIDSNMYLQNLRAYNHRSVSVYPNTEKQPVLITEFDVGGGNMDPLTVTGLTFRTTNTVADVSNARLMYQQNVTFGTFGNVVANPTGGNFSFTGSLPLALNPTYKFWLLFDIAPSTPAGTPISAEIISIQLDSAGNTITRVPANASPPNKLSVIADTRTDELRRTANWFFGGNAGLSFNAFDSVGDPIARIDGMNNSSETEATISRTNGRFAFYSNGVEILNTDGDTLVNGTNLSGNGSSHEGAIIVPQPCNDSLYYLFYAGSFAGSDSFWYSVVDMSLNGGLGAVIKKNILLPVGRAAENVAAVHHANGIDIWIAMVNRAGEFNAFLLKKDTLLGPFTSSMSINPPTTVSNSTLAFSPNGRWVTNTGFNIGGSNYQVLAQFDNLTGLTSPYLEIDNNVTNGLTGAVFSPNSSKLYYCYWPGVVKKIIQYDLNAGGGIAVLASGTDIYSDIAFDYRSMDRMENGPDGRIYFAESFFKAFGGVSIRTHIGVIENPDAPSASVNVYGDRIWLEGKLHGFGLPNFIDSYFDNTGAYNHTLPYYQPSDFTYFDTCFGNRTLFFAQPVDTQLTYSWNYGSGYSDSMNNTNYTFSDTGSYIVDLTISNYCYEDTISKNIFIAASPEIEITRDTVLCPGEKLGLLASGGDFYNWLPAIGLNANNIADPEVTFLNDVQYVVEVTKAGVNCSAWDTITIIKDLFCNSIFVPNAFSPNEDGVNDYFKINSVSVSNIDIKVFNRWGNLIAKSNDINYQWDGNNSKSLPSNQGVYVYVITGNYIDNEEIDLKGNITLIR